MAPLLDFTRALRDAREPSPAVVVVHHTGHSGEHLRGSSDLESYWETKISLTRSKNEADEYDFRAEHREAEAGQTHRFEQAWDAETRSVRLRLIGTLEDEARAFLEDNPGASANDFHEDHGGNRKPNLAAFKSAREQVVPTAGTTRNHPASVPPVGGSGEGGSPPTGGAPPEPPGYRPVPTTGTTSSRPTFRKVGSLVPSRRIRDRPRPPRDRLHRGHARRARGSD